MRIIGIDPSLNALAVAVWVPSLPVQVGIPLKGTAMESELQRMKNLFRYFRHIHLPQTIYILEDLAFGALNHSSSPAQVQGVVRVAISLNLEGDASSALYLVSPTSLKKFVTLSGRAKKEDMKLHLYKTWGAEPRSHDEADAYGLMLMGRYFLGQDSGLPPLCQARKESIQKMKPYVI